MTDLPAVFRDRCGYCGQLHDIEQLEVRSAPSARPAYQWEGVLACRRCVFEKANPKLQLPSELAGCH